jgi:hypothetical protein
LNEFRCAAASVGRGEAQIGTASTVRGFLLVECPTRWGRDVLRDAPMSSRIREQLRRLTAQGVKVLMMRRPGRGGASGATRLFAAHPGPGQAWMETALLDSIEEIDRLDLTPLASGRSVGLSPTDERLVCVCTHGRHDVCCAELGRPLAASLQASHPQQTWEISHVGGDRFAGNVLMLPHGLYYGRVEPGEAPDLMTAYERGHLRLDQLRGRASQPTPTQAAEWYLRRELGETSLDVVQSLGQQRQSDQWTIRFRRATDTWDVVVRRGVLAPAQLTCRAMKQSAAPAYELEHLVQVD